MDTLQDYLDTITNTQHSARFTEIFAWIAAEFPALEARIAWNQPMFTDHGTYIIGFSDARDHINFSPEPQAVTPFADAITAAGYSMGKRIVRIPDSQPVDYELLRAIIEFNITDKADCQTFWRA
ncbi:MAG: DUF1801 domain-containing protein [Propionibacteriaceae bacterium]|jgi:uncharacterized protein YdhG (YjbR/CyaY superfamily)|nr:DUF1801 domain-containing protein [Propionibacteriaceae bacterium]